MHQSNQLGPGITASSLEDHGSGGSWCTCHIGAGKTPPRDVCHVQFSAKISFKLVWCPGPSTPPTFERFVLVGDDGELLATGTPEVDHQCTDQFIDDIAPPADSSPATMADQEAQTKRMELMQMLPISQVPDDSCEQFGPSYRHLPSAFTLQRCSGRLDDLLCDGVLNDKWVACPRGVQASAGEMPFTLSNRNKFEEKLIKSEDERFTLDLLRTQNS